MIPGSSTVPVKVLPGRIESCSLVKVGLPTFLWYSSFMSILGFRGRSRILAAASVTAIPCIDLVQRPSKRQDCTLLSQPVCRHQWIWQQRSRLYISPAWMNLATPSAAHTVPIGLQSSLKRGPSQEFERDRPLFISFRPDSRDDFRPEGLQAATSATPAFVVFLHDLSARKSRTDRDCIKTLSKCSDRAGIHRGPGLPQPSKLAGARRCSDLPTTRSESFTDT